MVTNTLLGGLTAQVPAHATVTISTFAGTGAVGFSGDGGVATSAQLAGPQGVAIDDIGNVYIFDSANRRTRMVDRNGVISTIKGSSSYCGTSGVANNFGIDTTNCPGIPLSAGPGGTMYFSTNGWLNLRVSSGTQYHVAGKVTGSYSPGDGNPFGVSVSPDSGSFDSSTGALYFVEQGSTSASHSLKKWTPNGQVSTVAGQTGTNSCNYYASDGNLALGACIWPSHPVVWQDSIYFFDAAPGWRGPVIFRIDLNESPMRLHKVAGSGLWSDYGSGGLAVNAGLSSIGPLAVSSIGEIYLGNTNHGVIRKVDASGYMRDVANVGGREGGMAFDRKDNLYASLVNGQKVMKISGLGVAPINHGNLVTLGDSIAAGEGINFGWMWDGDSWIRTGLEEPDWSDTTETIGEDYQGCHQSEYAYSRLLHLDGFDVRNMACSGASVEAGILYPQTVGTQLIPAQLSDGPGNQFSAHGADTVILTVGANDINFAGWVRICYDPVDDGCGIAADTAALNTALADQKVNLRATLSELNARAYAASKTIRVVVTNYANPFSDAYRDCIDVDNSLVGIDPDEQDWLVSGLGSLNANIADEVDYAQLYYSNLDIDLVDISNAMAGHWFCTTDPWAYGPSISYFDNNPAPFHPTPAGQRAIYELVKAELL